jgi:signal peptidase I
VPHSQTPQLDQEAEQPTAPQADPTPSAGTSAPLAPQFRSGEAPVPQIPAPAEPTGWRSWSRDILASVAISLFIILFLYQPVRVEGTSMLPRLQDQDRLFINKFAYRFESIHRGDVVVFLYPGDHTKSYIKRVIALPGDAVRIDHGAVYVNDRPIREPYVPNRYRDERSEPERIIPAGDFWVMGDHRSISSDSRDFGPVPRALIYGKAAFVYWPMDQAGVVH